MVLKAETRIVEVRTPLKGIPVLLIIEELTTIMYIAAKKVVIPANSQFLNPNCFL